MSDRKYTMIGLKRDELVADEVYDPYPEDLDEDMLYELEREQMSQQ